jgi:hypothetical protein
MKTKAYILCFIALILVFSFNQASAQSVEIMSSPSGMITVHTNLQHYITGESIIFTGYIQKDGGDNNIQKDISLYTAVIDQDGTEVVNGIFPVKNGRVDGNLYLPDQLTDGNYIFIACPNQIKKSNPANIFSKIIKIERSGKNRLSTFIQLTDTLYKPGSTLRATISFFGNNEELLPVSFEYKLNNGNSEALAGKGKSGKDSPTTLNLTLPSFKPEDKIVLYITASYKSVKKNIGIVVPTLPDGMKELSNPGTFFNSVNNKQLIISIKPSQTAYSLSEKMEAEILVTDSNGSNVSTNLSVAANNINMIPEPIRNDANILSESGYNNLWYSLISGTTDSIPLILSEEKEKNDQHGPVFSLGMRNLYAGYLSSIMQTPARTFLIQEKNDIKKPGEAKKNSPIGKATDYSSERSIYDILMKIKPYTLVDNKIIFPSSGITSLNNQDGALIVIDGIKFGTGASALSNVAVSDILKITASTNSLDVQKYSALNSVGVVEVFTKTGATTNTNEVGPVSTDNKPLFWQTDIKTNFFGKATISFYNPKSSPVRISVTGLSEKGATGNNFIDINVK